MFLISYDIEPIFNKIGKYIQAQHYAAYSGFVLCFFLFLKKKRHLNFTLFLCIGVLLVFMYT